jgi:hypothetical protein
MASEADAARDGRLINALNPAASSGSAGISQRFWTSEFTVFGIDLPEMFLAAHQFAEKITFS